MKSQERHHLKQNEFAAGVARVTDTLRENRSRLGVTVLAAVIVIAGVAGYFYWRQQVRNAAGGMFAIAMAVAESPIAPAPTVPGATQAPGTYPTVQARQEAAVEAFQQVANAYPSTPEGLAALYHGAGELFSLGRLAEAQQAYETVIGRAGADSIYRAAARLGLAESLAAQRQYDQAIQEYSDLAAQRDGALPVDGILYELARTYLDAGQPDDARAAFKRIVDEFPNSMYVAEARQQMAMLG
jgi:tetratricopeptide (TPR) repeat protein